MRKSKRNNRWTLVEQNFQSLFITFALIELTNRGSAIIDGLFVSNFLDTDSISSVGIAKAIASAHLFCHPKVNVFCHAGTRSVKDEAQHFVRTPT
jgi:hypothetical protein